MWHSVLLALLGLSGCFAAVIVSVPPELEVELGKRTAIPCTHTISGNPTSRQVEWFITDKNSQRQRIGYRDEEMTMVDENTDYTGRVYVDADFSLVINEVDLIDERTFYCQVTAGASGSGEAMSNLKVFDPPEVPEVDSTVGVLSVTTDTAQKIATCTSRNGNPAPSITWYKDGAVLPVRADRNNKMYMVARTVKEASGLHSVSSTLYMKPTKEDKDSHFYCTVQYLMPKGKTESLMSEKFNLTLHYYSENVKFELVSGPVKEGDNVMLKCEADGSPPPEYTFFRVESDGEVEIQSGTESILTLENISKSQSGTFRCQALDFDTPAEIQLVRDLQVSVNYLDPLTLVPAKATTINLGSDLDLACSGTGSHMPKLAWRKGKEHVSDSGSLSLRKVTYRSTGAYTCEATVPEVPGLHKEQSVRIIVEGKPEIEEKEYKSEFSGEGEAVTLTCSVLGHPEPKVTWSIPDVQPSVSSSGNRIMSEVTLVITQKLVESQISCSATNGFGTSKRSFQLSIVPTTAASTMSTEVDKQQGGSSTAIIAVIVCVLLLLFVVALFYFLQKKGKLSCGKSEKKSLTHKETNTNEVVVEMKNDKRNEQRGLLSSSGGGRPMGD
ncbi:basal cell adhesion molecule isoform X2 [Ambystoma mexicanum]|uniref:basal cell adhesion molecule isoform X2 n=1 Tax=Ambystoma mexicanum TaxID=8296 RepID=UPI0037E7005A